MNKNEGRTIQAVERTLEIVEVLRRRGGATTAEIAESVGLSPANVHHHLTTLHGEGYVEKESGEYELSPRFLILGGPPRDRLGLFRLGRDDIDQIVDETGETARLVVEQNGYGVTIYHSNGELVEEHFGGLGHQETLHSTASGKTILAHTPRETVEEWLDRRGLPERTRNTITSRERLYEELETVRQEGIAFDNEEHVEGRLCIAAPVLQDDDSLLGALSLSVSTDRKEMSWFESEGIEYLRNAAGAIKIFNTYAGWMNESDGQRGGEV